MPRKPVFGKAPLVQQQIPVHYRMEEELKKAAPQCGKSESVMVRDALASESKRYSKG